ncbi:restriction endonuclease subunit S [Clostridium neonatale]|nr:restriction endonuclease subunit S [Clostridium neonatale]
MINLDCIEGMYLPNRFSRAYTDNPKAGVPMLGTSSMLNMKLPTDTRIFINKIRNSEKLFIESGDILISRSGTIGTSVLCGDTFVGFVASDHCIRLRLKKEVRGYIAAYLRTRYGMALLVKDAHGKVIKELTEENIQELPVMYFEDAVKKINDMMLNAVSKYDEARMLLDKVEERLDEELSSFLPKVQKSNNNIVPFHRLLINRIDPHMYNFYSEYIFREILKGKHRFLGDMANVWGTARFKRHYLDKDNPNGIGLYSSSDIVRANFSPSKFISKKLNAKELKKCEIETDTVLIPCSGTYGGIMGHGVLAGELMNGKAVTQHVLRVAKKSNYMDFYYIAAFLCSDKWGYHLISATRFGKDIPEIDPVVLKTIPIPEIASKAQEEIGKYFKQASILQEEANVLENEAIELLEKKYESYLINQ